MPNKFFSGIFNLDSLESTPVAQYILGIVAISWLAS